MDMDILRVNEINQGLKHKGRVYLCGNLKQDNGARFIKTENYEIGISVYPEFTFEKPHLHSFNVEYNYVLDGEIKIFLIDEKKEYHLKAGDLFVIHINEPYVGKAKAGSRTFFSKVPGGNDKVLVDTLEYDPALTHWGSSWEAGYQI